MLLRLPALVGAAVVLDHSGASVWILAAYNRHTPNPSHCTDTIPREPTPIPPQTLRDRPAQPAPHDHEITPAPPRQPHDYPVSLWDQYISFITNFDSDPMAPGRQDLRVAPPEHVYHEPDLIYLTRAYQLILFLEAFGHPDFEHSDISTTAHQIALTYPITQPTVYDTYLDAFIGRVPDH